MAYKIYYTKGSQDRVGQAAHFDHVRGLTDVIEAFEKDDLIDAYSVFGLSGMRMNPSDLQLKGEYPKWSKKT